MALKRIIAGKNETDDVSCIDDVDEGQEEDDNPLFVTNRRLAENGVIPLLSQAMAHTLAAVTALVRQSQENCDVCPGCLNYLHDRVSVLASLVDDASLMNDSNRRQFCEEGFTSESGGCLIVSLVSTLRCLADAKHAFRRQQFVWRDWSLFASGIAKLDT